MNQYDEMIESVKKDNEVINSILLKLDNSNGHIFLSITEIIIIQTYFDIAKSKNSKSIDVFKIALKNPKLRGLDSI